MPDGDTIAAIATAPGRGGVGVIRVSGKSLGVLATTLAGRTLEPRHAALCTFKAGDGAPIDQGLALFFPAPHSYTGEDVVELHGHGGTHVQQRLLARCLELGARLAAPGEFTQRAFLNDKLDLAQAESVADLIDAASVEAAQSAARSLIGEFSQRIDALILALIKVRMHVEACIDFPEEEIDAADRTAIAGKLADLRKQLMTVLDEARQGAVLREGLTVVLVGRPNVGKSSLLNCIAGEDLAIVTPIAGTTRDQVRATITLQGVPIQLVDTAGLRETDDPVERIGIERTWQAIGRAAAIIVISEAGELMGPPEARILQALPAQLPTAWLYNKIDLHGLQPGCSRDGSDATLRVSATTGDGIDLLRQWLLEIAGWQPHGEGVFMARTRHLEALKQALGHVAAAESEGQQWEIIAEELRLAHHDLGIIVGEFTADDLLGEIFSRFCIGK